MKPTDAEIERALTAIQGSADPPPPGMWWISGELYPDDRARVLAGMCLTLGRPVSAFITIELFAAVVDRLAAIERRLDRTVERWQA